MAQESSENGSKHYYVVNRITPDEVKLECKDPVDQDALKQAKQIIQEIKANDEVGGAVDPFRLLTVSKRLGDIQDETSTTFVVSKEECELAYKSLSDLERTTLTRLHERIEKFAIAQRHSIVNVEVDIPGGKAGHTVSPCRAAGCYAPGGRYPLPSSVLMTAVTARAAGCATVILASPNPAPITLAAAHVAGVDLMLGIGGAQAIATMAYGTNDGVSEGNVEVSPIPAIPKCDVIVGPGNKWVTAAKSLVNGYCGIDMLAGPSEVLVICDETCSAHIVAADLLAQAEHDIVARAILLCTSEERLQEIDTCVKQQLAELPEPNRSTATEAITKQSFAVLCASVEEMVDISDKIAPEHLEIQTHEPQRVADMCQNYGGLFIGQGAAEVLGDYGAGPNHTLPTGGTGRYTGGLSVFDFLRIRTYMKMDDLRSNEAQGMVQDSIVMARLEGLEAHARAAEKRLN